METGRQTVVRKVIEALNRDPSDACFVIDAGGIKTREAILLSVPTYSGFVSVQSMVDRQLIDSSLLRRLNRAREFLRPERRHANPPSIVELGTCGRISRLADHSRHPRPTAAN